MSTLGWGRNLRAAGTLVERSLELDTVQKLFFLLSLDSSEKFVRWLSSSSGSTREWFTFMSTICEICWRIRGKHVSAMTKINQLNLKINSTPSLSSNYSSHQGCKANKRVQTATQMATKKKKFYRSLLRCPWRWSTRLHSGRWTWISWDRAGSSYAPFNLRDKLAPAISCGNIIGRSDWTGCQSRAWLRIPCWAADDVLEGILELNYLFFANLEIMIVWSFTKFVERHNFSLKKKNI